MMVAITVPIASALVWGLTELSGYRLGTDAKLLLAAFASIVILTPQIQYFYPLKPTEESIAYDNLLDSLGRRIASRRT